MPNRFHLFEELTRIITMKLVLFSLLITLWSHVVRSEKQPVVRTPLGEVAGYYMNTRGGRQISAFTAIPYAIPPVGDLRFKVR